MPRTFALDTTKQVGKPVLLKGWVHAIRKMGKVQFFDLRDKSGIVQVVAFGEQAVKAKELHPEYVVAVEGTVQERGEKNKNAELPTGSVEVAASLITILNPSKTPPFEIENEDRQANEELRLKYRYLDLRHERMRNNILLRHIAVKAMRAFLCEKGFTEIETPYLTKGTPEGAREYVVPSRLHPGKFYVLPQSPQQFKQLLMVAGFERYFQVVRAFRDEDQRGDRQPEHTQLDMEMSFVEAEDVYALCEGLFANLVEELNRQVSEGCLPGKKLPYTPTTPAPFPRIPYAEAITKYGTDKPDLRKSKNNPQELAFAWITDFPLFEKSDTAGKIVSTHHPFVAPHPEDIPLIENDPLRVRANQYDLVLNGFEIASGSIRIHERELQNRVFKVLGLGDDEIQARFGHLLEAFEYGAPPHGGIAPGIDRMVMILAGEPNIREVIAFPKTGDARDLLMGAPSELPEKQLREAHINIIAKQ